MSEVLRNYLKVYLLSVLRFVIFDHCQAICSVTLYSVNEWDQYRLFSSLLLKKTMSSNFRQVIVKFMGFSSNCNVEKSIKDSMYNLDAIWWLKHLQGMLPCSHVKCWTNINIKLMLPLQLFLLASFFPLVICLSLFAYFTVLWAESKDSHMRSMNSCSEKNPQAKSGPVFLQAVGHYLSLSLFPGTAAKTVQWFFARTPDDFTNI